MIFYRKQKCFIRIAKYRERPPVYKRLDSIQLIYSKSAREILMPEGRQRGRQPYLLYFAVQFPPIIIMACALAVKIGPVSGNIPRS